MEIGMIEALPSFISTPLIIPFILILPDFCALDTKVITRNEIKNENFILLIN